MQHCTFVCQLSEERISTHDLSGFTGVTARVWSRHAARASKRYFLALGAQPVSYSRNLFV